MGDDAGASTYAVRERIPLYLLRDYYEDMFLKHTESSVTCANTTAAIAGNGPASNIQALSWTTLKNDNIDENFVTCTFKETLDAVKSGRVAMLTPKQYSTVWFPRNASTNMVSFTNEDLPFNLTHKTGETFYILGALLHRVYHAYAECMIAQSTYRRLLAEQRKSPPPAQQHAQEDMSNSDDFFQHFLLESQYAQEELGVIKRLRYTWWLYISTHFSMLHFFWSFPESSWNDSEMTTPSSDDMMSYYDAHYPHEHDAVWPGAMPDVTNLVQHMGWLGEVSKTLPMVHLAEKGKNVICALRGWDQIFRTFCREENGPYEFMNLTAMMSALRMYPDANFVPSISSAIETYHRFQFEVLQPEKHLDWMREHNELIWMSFREFIFYVLKQMPPSYFVLSRYINLNQITTNIIEILDTAAEAYERAGKYIDPVLGVDVTEMINENYRTHQLPYAFKVYKLSFIRMLLSQCDTMFEQRFRTHPEYCSTQIVNAETEERMRAYVARLPPDEHRIFCIEHFSHWEISPEILEWISIVATEYKHRGSPDHATKNTLWNVLFINPRDFHLIHMLAFLMVQHCRIAIYPLSAQTAEAQERALRARFNVEPWRTLPHEYLVNYYCPPCARLCASVVRPCYEPLTKGGKTIFNRTQGLFSYSHAGLRRDVTSGKLYDRRASVLREESFQTSKKTLEESGSRLLYTTKRKANIPTSREPRDLLKSRHSTMCRNTPVEPICLVGVLLRLNNTYYTLCETCASIVPYSMGCFGNGISCTHHIGDSYATLRPDSMLYELMGPRSAVYEQQSMCNPFLQLATESIEYEPEGAPEDDDPTAWARYGVINFLRATISLSTAAGRRNQISRKIKPPTESAANTRIVDQLASAGRQIDHSLEYGCYKCAKAPPARASNWLSVSVWNTETHQLCKVLFCKRDKKPILRYMNGYANGENTVQTSFFTFETLNECIKTDL